MPAYLPLPQRLVQCSTGCRPLVDRPGFGEIKPFNRRNLARGLVDLAKTDPRGGRTAARVQRFVIAYRPENASRVAVSSGVPQCVRVLTTPYQHQLPGQEVGNADHLNRHLRATWYDLGCVTPKGTLSVSLDDKSVFGRAIEAQVRQRFVERMVRRPNVGPTGSQVALRGADVYWDELAAFYRELAAELGDPFYRNLAGELAAFGAGRAAA